MLALVVALWSSGCRNETPVAASKAQPTAPGENAQEERPAGTPHPEKMNLIEAVRFLSECSANEGDLIEGLRQLATHNDGQFPNEMKLDKQIVQNLQQAKPSKGQSEQFAEAYKRMIMSMIGVKKEDRAMHYAGAGVKLGDTETPVFWYRPKNSKTYRVIYGDLSIKDVAAEDLPQKAD
jgi:hypothetical protein